VLISDFWVINDNGYFAGEVYIDIYDAWSFEQASLYAAGAGGAVHPFDLQLGFGSRFLSICPSGSGIDSLRNCGKSCRLSFFKRVKASAGTEAVSLSLGLSHSHCRAFFHLHSTYRIRQHVSLSRPMTGLIECSTCHHDIGSKPAPEASNCVLIHAQIDGC
jgi:hypothetical protein